MRKTDEGQISDDQVKFTNEDLLDLEGISKTPTNLIWSQISYDDHIVTRAGVYDWSEVDGYWISEQEHTGNEFFVTQMDRDSDGNLIDATELDPFEPTPEDMELLKNAIQFYSEEGLRNRVEIGDDNFIEWNRIQAAFRKLANANADAHFIVASYDRYRDAWTVHETEEEAEEAYEKYRKRGHIESVSIAKVIKSTDY